MYYRLDSASHTPDGDQNLLTTAEFSKLKSELKTGDLLVGVKNRPIPLLFRLSGRDFSYFTHPAVIEVNNESIVVWHAYAAFHILKKSPDLLGKVKGGVQSWPLEDFIRLYDEVEILRLPNERANARIVESAQQMRDHDVAYDPYFDPIDNDAICCTEMVGLALRDAGYVDDFVLTSRSQNPSITVILDMVNVTSGYILTARGVTEIPGVTRVAVISRYPNAMISDAVRDAVKLLHEEFTSSEDIHIRDWLHFSSERMMHFNWRIEKFLQAVEGLAVADPISEPAAIRNRNRLLYKIIIDDDSPESVAIDSVVN